MNPLPIPPFAPDGRFAAILWAMMAVACEGPLAPGPAPAVGAIGSAAAAARGAYPASGTVQAPERDHLRSEMDSPFDPPPSFPPGAAGTPALPPARPGFEGEGMAL
ncbi:MAG: hypothetical protein JW751_00300 [Polyangiaceae bacterium]|nr:hypothetical protein [Polyangiaceae bacterium]